MILVTVTSVVGTAEPVRVASTIVLPPIPNPAPFVSLTLKNLSAGALDDEARLKTTAGLTETIAIEDVATTALETLLALHCMTKFALIVLEMTIGTAEA